MQCITTVYLRESIKKLYKSVHVLPTYKKYAQIDYFHVLELTSLICMFPVVIALSADNRQFLTGMFGLLTKVIITVPFGGAVYFVTCTFNNYSVPHFDYERVKCLSEYNCEIDLSGYDGQLCFGKDDVQQLLIPLTCTSSL